MALNDLTTMLQQGKQFARPSHFKVSCPDRIQGADSFFVKAASLPAATLNTIEVPYYGRKVRIPSTRTFDTWNITVIYGTDGTHNIRSQFETWLAEVQGPEDHFLADNSVLSDWEVTLLNPTDSTAHKTIKMVGCYPAELGSIDLNQETSDSLSEFTATMRYTYHEVVASTNPGSVG
jgi:hypothetical protein